MKSCIGQLRAAILMQGREGGGDKGDGRGEVEGGLEEAEGMR